MLVLHRADAPVIPLELSRSLAASLPDARLELLPGTSASLFFEDPEGVADRIATFAGAHHVAAADAAMPRPAGAAAPGLDRRSPRRPVATRARGAGSDRRMATRMAQIAAGLGISVNTVERHVSNVYRKIDARGRADATAWALRRGVA